jgi:transposase InsO family protein
VAVVDTMEAICVSPELSSAPESPNDSKLIILPPDTQSSLHDRLSRRQYKNFMAVLDKYREVFNNSPPAGLCTRLVEHSIETSDNKPVSQAPYRVTPERRVFIEQEVCDMKTTGVISESKSPWASPVVLSPKKDGKLRFCVDYRRLNKATKRDVYPLPVIDTVLSSMQGMKWFSSLDLAQGFWQVPVEAASREKTAFITTSGLYEFNVMPFGLTNAPATFQRLMDLVLAGIKWKCCLVYMDDIIIFSTSFEQHLLDLREVFERIHGAGLFVKPSKCDWCQNSIKYLGHVISAEGLSPDPDKVAALAEMPAPTTVKQLQSFIGFVNYYRMFVRDFARICVPLYALLRAKVHWQWGARQQAAFEKLKTAIANAVLLIHPDFHLDFILDTDGSQDGLGAVLSQVRDNIEEPIAFASRTLTGGERKWHCCEFEALAVVWGVQTFAHYLADRHFTVRVDHHNLRWLQVATRSRLQRWALELQEFDFTVQYRRGVEHCNCDGLSRNPLTGEVQTPIIDGQCSVCTHTNTPHSSILAVAPVTTFSGFSVDELRLAQQADVGVQHHITMCKTRDGDVTVSGGGTKSFIYENDLLFLLDNRTGSPVLKLVIPEGKFREKLLEQFHGSELAGHLGVTKTLGRLRDRYYWTGMAGDVRQFVARCAFCQLRKTRHQKFGFLNPISVEQPWQLVGMDLYGELPRTFRGNRWVLVLIDHFTKWPEIIPLRHIDASTIAGCIHKYLICRHGCPAKLLSDRGPQFMSQIVRHLCKRYGIEKLFTTAYHPQGDPQAEAFMKVLGNSLAVLSKERGSDWDEFCESIAFACRTAVHPTTRYTPFFLNHLREAQFPQDLALPDELGFGTIGTSCDLPEARLRVMKRVRQQVHGLLKSQQSISKQRYDLQRLPTPMAIGSLVMLQVPPNHLHKLGDRWVGPFTVCDISPNGLVYTIQRPKSGACEKTHVSRLHPFFTITPDVSRAPHDDVCAPGRGGTLPGGDASHVPPSPADADVYVDVAMSSDDDE